MCIMNFYQYPYQVKFIKHYLEQKVMNMCDGFINRNNTCLSLSFGKDSMVILHILHKFSLLNKVKLVMFNNSGFDSEETIKMKDYVISYYNIDNFIETKVDEPEKFIKIDIENSLTKKSFMPEFAYNVLEKPRWEIMDKFNINGTIIGLRKEESNGRKINYYLRGYEYYNKRELANILQPIVNWSVLDVFSYLFTNNVPINPIYFKAKKMGFDFKFVRVNTLASLDFKGGELNRIAINRILFPNEFKKLETLIPEIRRLR